MTEVFPPTATVKLSKGPDDARTLDLRPIDTDIAAVWLAGTRIGWISADDTWHTYAWPTEPGTYGVHSDSLDAALCALLHFHLYAHWPDDS